MYVWDPSSLGRCTLGEVSCVPQQIFEPPLTPIISRTIRWPIDAPGVLIPGWESLVV